MIKSAVTRLRDLLEEEIASGMLKPGERLDEAALAARYNVSRTPVREALMQLAGNGLVLTRPRRGTIVADLSPNQLFEMFDVMGELEGMAGRLAARRRRDEDTEFLLATHESCRAAVGTNDADQYYYENEKFHQAIYRASRSKYLQEQCLALSRRLRPYRRMQLRFKTRMLSSFAEHEGIVNAVLANDEVVADSLLRQHVIVQGDRFADLIASLPDVYEASDNAKGEHRLRAGG